jgi:methyl-accepting chemotaxis protein
MSTNSQNLLLIIAAVGAFALLLQTVLVIAFLVMMRRAVTHVEEEMRQYRSAVMPLILQTRDLVRNLAPKLEDTANDFTFISRRLREQTAEIQAAADEIIDRTRYQANRVDGMITSVFDRVERAGVFVSDTISKPMRQITGVIASVRAAVETFIEPHSDHHSPEPQTGKSRYSDGESIPEPRNTGTTAGYRS